MPEIRLQRARATLPEGYQFGDGKWTLQQVEAKRYEEAFIERSRLRIDETMTVPMPKRWRAPHENAAELLARGIIGCQTPWCGCRIENA